MKELLKKVSFIIICCFYFVSILPAGEIVYSIESGRTRLDHYLEEAGDNISEENWEEQAEKGMMLALSEWESENQYLKDIDPEEYERNYENAKSVFELEKAKKYAQWLFARVNRKDELKSVSALKEKIKEAVKDFDCKDYSPEEAEMLAASEGSRLLTRFYSDTESLKAEKANDAAKVIAGRIADDAAQEGMAAMNELFSHLEQKIEGAEAEGIDSDELLTHFKEVFNKGLAVWEEAELDFLTSRAEWEKEAKETLKVSEETWNRAFEELKAKRSAWEQSIQEKIAQMQEKLSRENERNSATVAEALQKYQAVLNDDLEKKMQVAAAQVNIYNTLRNGLETVYTGLESLTESMNRDGSGKYRGLYSYWKTEAAHNVSKIDTELCKKVEDHINKSEALKNDLKAKTFLSWFKQAEEYNKKLNETVKTLYNLTGNAAAADGWYSELDLEICKAQAVQKYWEDELEIAKAVEKYAVSNDSSRESKETTQENLRNSEEAYENAVEEYTKALRELEVLNQNVAVKTQELQESYSDLAEARAAVEEINKEYQQMYAIYKGINADTIIQQLKTYINFYNKSVEEKDNSASGYYKYNYHQAEKEEFKELEEKEAQVKSVYESTLEFLNNFRNAVKEEASDSIGYSILGTNLENTINSYYITSSIQKIFIEDTDCFNAYYNTEFSELKKMLSALDSMNSTMVDKDKIELREYEVETLKAKVIALIDYIINIENTKLSKLTGQNTEGQIEKYSEKILKEYEDSKAGYSEETKEQYEALIADMLSVENHYAEELLSATEAASENSGKYKTEDIISGYEAAKIEVSKFLLEANTINASSEDYGNIIDCCVELYGKLKNVSNTYSSYIAEYLNMYLQKEAFRYQLLSEKSADYYKSMLGKISTELRQTEESLIKEDEVDNENIRLGDDALLKLVRLNFEYTFLNAAYEESVNNSVEWLKTLGELKFASQTRLSDEDKALYASMIENRAENYMTECQKEMNIILEAAGMSKESYDALSEEDIQKLQDQNVKYQGALETEADYLSRINISSELFAQLNQTVTQAALDAKIAEIAAAEKNSQQKQQLYEAAIKNLQKAADEYNTYLDKTNDLYENTQEARLEKRKAQAVYDWAESVYLGTIGENTESTYETPKEAVSSAEYSLNRAMLSVKILNDIKKEKVTTSASPEEQSYIDAERQYYLSYVMFEHQNASVQEVFRNLEEAENEENIKRNSVVTSSAGFNFSKYVNLTYDESTKSYRYSLSNGSNNTSEETQRKFFLAKTESIERTTTANLSVTPAEVEVMDFLERMTGNQSYFNNVILAAMYYLSEKDGSYENSIYSSAVNSDSGITNSSGTNASDRLKDYTIEAARNAYNSLVASGKTEDIARCILFRNSNSVFASNIKKIEKNLVRSIAFARLENRMEERQGEWGCYYIIISFFRRKRTLTSKGRAAEAMERAACDRKNGAVRNYNEAYSNITRALDAFKTSKNNVASKQGEYNKALYGSAVKPEGKLTSAQIKNYLTDVFVNKTSLSIDEINSLIAEIKDEDEFTDTNEAVRLILERSGQKTDAAYEAMSGRLATERKSQTEASDAYNGQLIKEIHISDDVKAELKKLAQKAADATLTVEQRKKAVEEYDRLYATIDWKEDEEELRNLAGKAYGEGTLCISDHYKNLFDYYRNYFDGNLAYSHLNLNNGKDAYWFDDAETVNSGKVSVVSEYLQFYQELLAERAANKFDEYKAGLDQNLKSFSKENEDVLTQLNKIVLIAGNEWDKAGEKLNARYNTWHRDFNRTYVNASREWQESYEEFLSDKQQWITQMYMSAGAETGYSGIDADEQARKALKKAKAEKVNGVEKVSFDATEYIEKLIGTTALSALNSHMDQLESRIGSSRLIADRNYKADAAAVTALFESMNIIDEVTASMEKTAARLVAQDAAAQLDESIESAYKSVETANKSFEDNIREMVYDAGYTWEGNKISRRVLKHAYLFTDDYTEQTIHCYEWYRTNRPELTVTSAMFDGLEGDGVISLMNAATMQLTDWQEKVFGIHNGTVEKEGEFDKHIGKAPDGTTCGSGEFGRIMLDFSNNENEMQAGLAEMAAAPWDRKIAPSPVSWMEMPSLRTVGTVAAAVAATVVSAVVSVVSFGTMAAPMAALCAAGISAAITLSTEATFAALDVSGGYKSWDEVGKSLAISAATSAIGALGGAAGAAVGSIGGIGGALLKTGISVGTSAASTVTSNAIQYAGDWDGFKNSMTSFDTWRGTLTSGAGALVTNSLNGINYDGFNGGQIGKIGSFSSLAGGLASNALEYGLTGETTFNVLNIADLGLNTFLNNKYNPVGADGNRRYNGTINASSGLLELHVGRDSGATLALGTGGTDIGMTALANSYEGMKYFGKNLQIEAAAHAAKMGNAATALRMQYGYGTDEQKKNLNDILSGKAVLRSGGTDGRAKTVLENGKRTIYLNEYSDKMTREEKFRMGITLGHEAYRDGIVTTPDGQFAETAGAVFGHTFMAKQMQADGMYGSIMNGIINGDANLTADIAAFDKALASNDWSSFGSYVAGNYDSSADYWKLVQQESGIYGLEYDGKHSLYDADGNLLIRNEMDQFDENGENLGPWDLAKCDYTTFNSFAASLGMLLGTYTNYMYDKDAYELNWNNSGNTELRKTTLDMLSANYSDDFSSKKDKSGIIDANPYLMTYAGLKTGNEVVASHSNFPGFTGMDNYWYYSVPVRNERNEIVGTIEDIIYDNTGYTNINAIENMIPEGKRLKAGAIVFRNGEISMYGLSTTMPDPNLMGTDDLSDPVEGKTNEFHKYSAIDDGTYYYANSLHHINSGTSYQALRLFDPSFDVNCSWSDVTGSSSATPVSEFPYTTSSNNVWNAYRLNFPSYYYDGNGQKVSERTTSVNWHDSYSKPFVLMDSKYIGGSEACLLSHPFTKTQIFSSWSFVQRPDYGKITINRSYFGDGTGGRNDWNFTTGPNGEKIKLW